ncbi:hypothetical protein NGA35_04080 [Pseudomonas stutzeri]|nr:hypothetical protein [Stutzerimonas stutzeri]
MILVTVGTQLPFDRLIITVANWAKETQKNNIVAQVGKNGARPNNIDCSEFFEPQELARLMQESEIIISHAGMGSILAALTIGKKIIILPRIAALNEHRNEHQLATAKHFLNHPGINVAFTEGELLDFLNGETELKPPILISPKAPADFTEKLKSIIDA